MAKEKVQPRVLVSLQNIWDESNPNFVDAPIAIRTPTGEVHLAHRFELVTNSDGKQIIVIAAVDLTPREGCVSDVNTK